jgi:UrcA family protein
MHAKTIFIASAIALGAAFNAVPADAAETIIVSDNPEPHATVSIADLNLDSPAGVARLERRIEGAANELCLTRDVEPLGAQLARAKCYRTAISSGRRQIDHLVAARGANATTAATAILTVSGR